METEVAKLLKAIFVGGLDLKNGLSGSQPDGKSLSWCSKPGGGERRTKEKKFPNESKSASNLSNFFGGRGVVVKMFALTKKEKKVSPFSHPSQPSSSPHAMVITNVENGSLF